MYIVFSALRQWYIKHFISAYFFMTRNVLLYKGWGKINGNTFHEAIRKVSDKTPREYIEGLFPVSFFSL